jgi:hypothetical protein
LGSSRLSTEVDATVVFKGEYCSILKSVSTSLGTEIDGIEAWSASDSETTERRFSPLVTTETVTPPPLLVI